MYGSGARERGTPPRNLAGVHTLTSYLDALASAQPTPGGGSAATITGASAAALIAMVARITLDNPKFTEKHARAHALVERADSLRALLQAGREIDETAYGAVVSALKLPNGTPEERSLRTDTLQQALAQAAAAPLEAASLSLQVLELAERCLALENANLISDVGCAAELASAALAASALNVRTNHRFIKDASLTERQEHELRSLEKRAGLILSRVRSKIKHR